MILMWYNSFSFHMCYYLLFKVPIVSLTLWTVFVPVINLECRKWTRVERLKYELILSWQNKLEFRPFKVNIFLLGVWLAHYKHSAALIFLFHSFNSMPRQQHFDCNLKGMWRKSSAQGCGDDDASDAGIGYGGFEPGSIEPGRWPLERRGEEEPRWQSSPPSFNLG